MMHFAEVLQLIETTLATTWSVTPIAYENVDARNQTQVGQPLLPAGTADYLAVRVVLDTSRAVTVPGRCRRYTGTLYLALCVMSGQGSRQLATYLDQLNALFDGTTLNGSAGLVRFSGLTFSRKYAPAEGWYVHEVGFSFAFERDTTFG